MRSRLRAGLRINLLPSAALLFALALIQGCVGTRPRTSSKLPPNQTTANAPSNQSGSPIQAPQKQQAAGQGITITWDEPTANGGIRRVLHIDAQSGSLDAITQSGVLKDAKGEFFRDGRARARFTAPEVVASRDKQVVTARGGVKVTSIDPVGVKLTAEQVTWYSNEHRIAAQGRVAVTHMPKGASKPIATGHAEHATANTELQEITIP